MTTEARDALKGLLRNLEDVRAQRVSSYLNVLPSSARERLAGEIWGLDVAILAIKRRLR